MVSLGVRTDDQGSGSPILARNRTIFTYYHGIENFGLAQVHVARIAENVGKATDAEPHQLVVRLRAPGGKKKTLAEYLDDAKREFGESEHAAHFRIFENSDGSLDAELRVETNGDFDDTLLALGETRWPRSI